MWITGDVELPGEILDAYERGELVFFVGAGASLDAPSNLPLFNSLAAQLAEMANHPFDAEGGLDYFIGKLESLTPKFDAHRHAHEIISNPESNFNSTHESIAELAHNSGAFRVVTTNYDDHLASAIKGISEQVPDVWYGPALPLGDHFEGIVHLHGSILRPNNEMILSDRDFGRAYLTEAWATRFLLPMFSRYTVVFIGYSHDDTIMRYLALGLPSRGEGKPIKRFAFTDDPNNHKWKYLGINAIGYPANDNDHKALPAALTAWSNQVKMGQAEHRARLLNIISGGKQITPLENDYLCFRLKSEAGARDFVYAIEKCSDNEKLDWLDWIKTLEQFGTLFKDGIVSRSSEILASWFTGTFVESSVLNGAALQVVHQMGQSMSDYLFKLATRSANVLHREDKEAGLRWQTLLSTSIRGQSAPVEVRNFMPNTLEGRTCGLPLLSVSLRPSLILKKRFFIEEKDARKQYPDAEVSWNANEYILTKYINQIVAESVPGDFSLGSVLIQSITEGYLLLNAYHGSKNFDVLSFGRSAIEPHEQDKFRKPIDALIDGLRDYGLKALSVHPTLPELWWNSQYKFLQRLAIHLVTYDENITLNQKLEWLISRVGLYEVGLKHESYQLLAKTLSDASLMQKKQVLVAAEVGPDIPDDASNRENHIAYAKFNLLAWLVRVDPSWEEAQVKFDQVRQENPDFEVREHPDFDHWMTSGTWGGTLPMEVDEFLKLVGKNADVALYELVSSDYSRHAFDKPSWDDALELIEKAACQRPDLGLQLWDATTTREELGEKRAPVWGAIAEGWGKAEIGELGVDIVDRLTVFLDDGNSAGAVAEFLLNQGLRQIELGESAMTVEMRKLAKSLWDIHGAIFSYPEGYEPLSFAPLYLNSWSGKLARYWRNEVDRRWRKNRDNWEGLSSEESAALTSLLAGSSHALDATQPAIAGELFFYFAADEDFAIQHLLPIFDDLKRHAYAWFSYLHHPRYNDRLLAGGLLESMLNEFERLGELPDGSTRQSFLKFVISVITYAEISSSERDKLLNQSNVAANGAYAIEFAQAVERFIRDDEVDAAAIWDRWLGNHLRKRVEGIPRVAIAEELEAWADLVPLLGAKIPDAIELLSGQEIGFAQAHLYIEVPSHAFKAYGDKLIVFFTDRIRSTSALNAVSSLGYTIRHLAEEAQKILGQEQAQRLIDAAADKGFIEFFE